MVVLSQPSTARASEINRMNVFQLIVEVDDGIAGMVGVDRDVVGERVVVTSVP